MSQEKLTIAPAGGIQRQAFAGTEVERGQLAAAAQAAQARAMIESRFVVAMKNRRSWDNVRSILLQACERPGFAGDASGNKEKNWGAAWYRKPVGDGVEGFSVRFAEEAMRAMGNIAIMPATVYDDEALRIVNVDVIDLESNTSISTSITVEKTIERKALKPGEQALRVRLNSKQQPLYILPATDEEVYTKQRNLESKAKRTGLLQLLPGDIQAECRKRILEIRFGDSAKDPGKVRRQIADGFAKLNILPAQLEEYLDHELATCSPAELTHLRELWEAIRDGKLSWLEAMQSKEAEEIEAEEQEQQARGLDALTDKLRAKQPPAPPAIVKAGSDPACPHPDVPETRLAPGGLAPGEEIACKDCGQTWRASQ